MNNSQIDNRNQDTDTGSKENTMQDKYQNYTYTYHFQTTENQDKEK